MIASHAATTLCPHAASRTSKLHAASQVQRSQYQDDMPLIYAMQITMQHRVARMQRLQKVLLQARCRRLTFSSMKFRQPSLGTKAAIFFPFLISWTRAHFRIAELGCLASIPLHMVTAGSGAR